MMNSITLILFATLMRAASSFSLLSTTALSSSKNFNVRPSFALKAESEKNYYGDDDDDDGRDLARVPRRRQRRRMFENEEEESDFYDRVEERVYGRGSVDEEEYDEDDEEEEEDDDDEEDDEEWEDYDMFSNVIIDNPLLDSIDPDGAAQRFPELARDPRFWIDMVLFISFLNFLSDIGPQNTLPDLQWYPNGDFIDMVGVNTLT